MAEPVRRVAVLLAQRHHKNREITLGLVHDRGRARAWHLLIEEPTADGLRRALRRQPDGIVVQGATSALIRRVHATGLPAVNVSHACDDRRLPAVWSDDAAAGRLAAEHLLARSALRFAALGDGTAYAAERIAGFAARIGGCVARTGTAGLAAWLRGLPKPIGVFAVTDRLAYAVARACAEADIAVPDAVAVIGCDDDELTCCATWPALSSVPVPGRRIGVEAAALLERLWRRRAAPAPVRVPPDPPVARASTDTVACDHPLARALIARLRDGLERGDGVRQAVRGLGASRRTIEGAVRAACGASPAQLLIGLRVERAAALLRATELPLERIAARCGVATAAHLATLFKRRFGATPAAWRSALRAR